ncbi:MAG: 30S ribosomal protein S20 [Ignavibacteriaceae bacterium]
MANHKSAKKRIRTSERRRKVNVMAESRVKTHIKKALAATDPAEAETLYKAAVSVIDRETTSGIIHRNNAARKKSALTKHVNGLKASK